METELYRHVVERPIYPAPDEIAFSTSKAVAFAACAKKTSKSYCTRKDSCYYSRPLFDKSEAELSSQPKPDNCSLYGSTY
jgi:hypothetical protein